MAVAVISRTGKKLMPTSEYRDRRLLKSGKAVKHSFDPFTIRLTEREDGNVQPIEVCVDTGYIHIGISAKSENHEYLALQVDTLTNERERHEAQKTYRCTRRNRKRYRKPRFDNRRRDKEGKWLPPSLEHKKDVHIQRIKRICDVMPVTDITMEMGNFDTQVLKAIEEGRPLPEGKDYQHGERYGIATLREAVFSRDNYTCQCCGRSIKDHAILHAHHAKYRSQGGTDRIGNVVTVCEKCHTPANHQPGGKLWNWKPKIKSFKGATYMTAVRWKLYHEVKALFPDKEEAVSDRKIACQRCLCHGPFSATPQSDTSL